MALLLLDLPPEVLHIILYHCSAVTSGRVKLALRLRLVCKSFAALLYPALFEHETLDSGPFRAGIGTLECQALLQNGGDKMWHAYLVWRVMGATPSAEGRYMDIRRVADAARAEMEMQRASCDDAPALALAPVPELAEVVGTLCWLLLRQEVRGKNCGGKSPLPQWWGPSQTARRRERWRQLQSRGSHPVHWLHLPAEETLYPLSLLSAAAYLNLPVLAQRLLDDGYNPHHHDFLFAPALQLAAQAGHGDMLSLLRRSGRAQDPRTQGLCTENWALVGAAIRGDIGFLGLVLQGESLPARSPTTHWAKQYSSAQDVTERCHARSPDIYDCISAAFCPGAAALEPYPWELAHYARLGNLDMVDDLLDRGLPINPTNGETPLVAACRGGHHDVARALLECGADPNHPSKNQNGADDYALHLPATAGSLALTCLLLNHGANTHNPWPARRGRYPALWWAFSRENPAVILLLVSNGATVANDQDLRESIARMLDQSGSESMQDLFRQLCEAQIDLTPSHAGESW